VINFEVNIRESGYEQVRLPLYNMEVTSFGVAAQFGFNVAGTIVQVVDACSAWGFRDHGRKSQYRAAGGSA
jgi:hypothetical protein